MDSSESLDNETAAQPEETSFSDSTSMQRHGDLCDLMLDEVFLHSVLSHLINFGLYECSRVCKTWNAVVKELPVKLANIQATELPSVLNCFPSAVAITDIRDSEGDYGFSGVMDALKGHLGIRHLGLTRLLPFQFRDTDDGFPFIEQLESLSISCLHCTQLPEGLVACLRRFTRLTCLRISLKLETDNQPLDVEPLYELKRIEILEADGFWTNQNGAFMFPALGNLTEVILSANDKTVRGIPRGTLEMFLPFTDTLTSLTVRKGFQPWLCENAKQEVLHLCQFTKLTALKTKTGLRTEDILLPSYQYSLGTTQFADQSLMEDVSAALMDLPRLQSLSLSGPNPWIEDALSCLFKGLSGLTELRLWNVFSCYAIHYLKYQLVVLEIRPGKSCGMEFEGDSLPLMPHLESFGLLSDLGMDFNINCLQKMPKLRSLELRGVNVHCHIFKKLAAFELTRLHMSGWGTVKGVQTGLLDVNCITTLVDLRLDVKSWWQVSNWDPRDFIQEGCLSKLWYLQVPLKADQSQEIINAIFRRLPNLRRIN